MSQTRISAGARAWMLFDWANQPFYTLIITFIFAPYFVSQVIPDPVVGQAVWANMNLGAALIVAITAPILGAIADKTGRRKPWIAGFSLFFVVGCLGLWLAAPEVQPFWPIMLFFMLAFVMSEYSLIFINAMLPDLGPREEIGRISGSGWATGYAGGVVVLLVVLAFIAPTGGDTTIIGMKPLFGLDPDQGEPARLMGPLAAMWFVIFALPMFWLTPDTPKKAPLRRAVGEGVHSLMQTLRRLPQTGGLLTYLISSMVYRDALAGMFAFGGIYAGGVLGWGITQLGIFGIVAAFTGAFGAFLGGRADSAYGPRPVIAVSIVLLMLVAVLALMTNRDSVLLIPVAPGSAAPDIVYYFCGGILGACAGSLQASSRTLLVFMAEDRLPMTEAFGLYALSGKATAFLAPLLIGVVTLKTGSQAWGVSPVIALFGVGLILLYWVKPPKEARA